MVLVGRFRCCTAIGCESAEEGKSGAFSDMVFDVAYDGKLVTETKRVMEKECRLMSKSTILRDSISERLSAFGQGRFGTEGSYQTSRVIKLRNSDRDQGR